MTIQVEDLLNRLQKVKRNGKDKWMACCPAHEDKTPSMSVKVADDGRILVHDFGGCSVFDICGAIGVEVKDLFPPSRDHGWRSEEKRLVGAIRFTAMDALRGLSHEGAILAIMAADMAEGRVLAPKDRERLAVACDRISTALGYIQANDG